LVLSPALELAKLESFGKKIYFERLVDIVRQNENSGIVMNSLSIRNMIDENTGYPEINTSLYEDTKKISGGDLIEEISNSYDMVGYDETIIICRSNKRANKYNEGIRQTILWREEEISKGDQLMVVKNNYYWNTDDKKIDFIANGEILEVDRIYNYEELHGLRFANIRVRHLEDEELEFDTKIILDTLMIEGPALPAEQQRDLFYSVQKDYSSEPTKKKRIDKIKDDPYYNSLQVKFAYAVTCHKSQGGQWKHVYIDQGFLTKDMLNSDFMRWLYTAITRATEYVYLVNFSKEFFPLNEQNEGW